MALASLRWTLNRLRTMGVREIGWRVAQRASARLEAWGVGHIPARAPTVAGNGARWLDAPPPTIDRAAILAEAEAVSAGRFNVFALRRVELGMPPQWNRDPRTGRVAPLVFGKTLDYRDAARVGDIKYLWEPSRHLELVTLAQAFVLTGQARHAHTLCKLLSSWFDQCPYPRGVHWTSSLEHAVRLMNWAVAWQLLDIGGWLARTNAAGLRARWLGEIYRHQRFIVGHFSRYSSANNHLFGEYAGLFIASTTWPLWPESGTWRAVSQAGLEREAKLQITADGVNREQALWYQHEVADMMLLTLLAGRRTGNGFGESYDRRLESAIVFIASVADVAGNVPMIGDSDDAVMVRFAPARDFCVYRSLLASAAVLFRRPDLAAVAGAFDDKSRWLLGAGGEAEFLRLRQLHASRHALPRAFPAGGYWVLGNRLGEADELRLVVDAGPLGYLSIAAHGHADALSFTLSAGGCQMLVDPGTYAYHTHRAWRDYFKGTSAHNTVRVDGLDQSDSGGNFMWLHHARARCERHERDDAGEVWAGSHDGYRRLADPVTHRRAIRVRPDDVIEVTDVLESAAPHDVEVFWHFSEHCEVRIDGGDVVAQNGPVALRISFAGHPLAVELVEGRELPPLGWISRRFDEKQPTACVRLAGRLAPGAKWTAILRVQVAGWQMAALEERDTLGVT